MFLIDETKNRARQLDELSGSIPINDQGHFIAARTARSKRRSRRRIRCRSH